MLIVSSVIVSPGAVGFARFLTVILTVRSAVFICGETDVIVPDTMVPFFNSIVTDSFAHFIRNLTSFMVSVSGLSLAVHVVCLGAHEVLYSVSARLEKARMRPAVCF